MVKEGEIITLQQKIPNRWNKAIDAFEKSKILPEYLGHEFSQSFIVIAGMKNQSLITR